MQQALTSPVFRSAALGGVLLAIAVGAAVAGHAHKRRLVLHTVSRPCSVYITAWHRGDVTLSLPDGPLQPITFRTRAWVDDGCRWQGTETLKPVSATRYAYRYEEQILQCEPGAEPYDKTPRRGYVDVVD